MSPGPAFGMNPRTCRSCWSSRRNSRPVSRTPVSADQGRKTADPSGAFQATPSSLILYWWIPFCQTPLASACLAWCPGDSRHTRSKLQHTSSAHRQAAVISSARSEPWLEP